MKREKGYTRKITSLYRVMKRLNIRFYTGMKIRGTSKIKHNKKYHRIRSRTPQHNSKVERSHRNDNERFYSYLKFYSFEDLQKQGKAYLKRSNNIPMSVLRYLTPREKRQQLEVA